MGILLRKRLPRSVVYYRDDAFTLKPPHFFHSDVVGIIVGIPTAQKFNARSHKCVSIAIEQIADQGGGYVAYYRVRLDRCVLIHCRIHAAKKRAMMYYGIACDSIRRYRTVKNYRTKLQQGVAPFSLLLEWVAIGAISMPRIFVLR